MEWPDLALQAITVMVSVSAGSGLSYLFALRSSRKEREYDSKVNRYNALLSGMTGLKDSILIFRVIQQYDPAKDEDLARSVVLLFGLANGPLGHEKLQQIVRELDESDEITKNSGPVENARLLTDRLSMELGLTIARHAREVQEIGIGLAVIGSSAIDSDEHRALQADLELVANELLEQLLGRLSDPAGTYVPKPEVEAAEARLPDRLTAFMKVIRKEIRDTL